MRGLRWSILIFSAATLGFGAYAAVFQNFGLFVVRTVPVEVIASVGGERARSQGVAEKRMQERLMNAVKHLEGRKIWDVEMSAIRAAIAQDEWVKEILVARSFPNGLKIQVRPKVTALVMLTSQGKFIPVTEDGEMLSPLPISQIPDVPLLRGEIFKNDVEKRMTIVRFAMSLAAEGQLGRANISEFTWHNDEGYSLTLIQPKVEVKLGDERLDLKSMRVAQVLSYLSVNGLKGRVIDASFSKKVLVRLRKGP